ncbi:ribonuclease R [Crassaminicella thermophila]|uniref:Ribonuclease R n=1 Tax=Crassaminicella thermophila TaxID=2599308 RepID=A0A5C0SBC8_CRATE|nr:ribonuclease R [Crassaminicella thermophila]QEK11863.1 ribonuclease R [Crassaminicella thermophila]
MAIKEKILEFMREKAYNPMLDIELANVFNIKPQEIGEFYAVLDEMEKKGQIIKTKKNRYAAPERMNLIVGKLQQHSKGFGFILSEIEGYSDVFVSSSDMNGAMHNDRVIGRITKKGGDGRRAEGEIIRILERANAEIVGTFESSKNFGFVVPDDTRIKMDIYIPKSEINGAKDGYKVVAQITKWPEPRRNPEGKIIEILGHKDDVGTDIISIIKKYKLSEVFPKKVEAEAANIPEEIPQEEINRRRDLRNEKIVTIDGLDAKDLDDAVSVKKLSNGNYLLGVHIADVTHYVKEHSRIDKEAFKRGTSVYLVDRVIPMLPKKLSNGVCSLNPKVDRLTLSVNMEIDKKGKVVNHEIYESVIKTCERMTYTDVSDILEKDDEELKKRYAYLLDDFKLMEELAKILRKKREERGSIDFDFDESKVIVDDKGIPVEIKKAERRIANRIIEEFMLICNETVAEHFHWSDLPFVYRIHEDPDIEKIENFNKFIHNFGYHLKGITNEIHPRALQDLLKKVEGKKEERIINTIMLRSLKKARYSPQNTGHFGLAADNYCHFTSPIRRYPDLQIHRIIKESLSGKLTGKRIKKLKGIVENAAEQSSERERIAVEAERETEDLKKTEYMTYHIGEEFEGIISSVVSFGMFVELENTIEGLVRISSLVDDYYIYDEENYLFRGERTKKTYRIGDEVRIKVIRADVSQKEIDFILV